MILFYFFSSGTVRRASARPYYDKTQRCHAQSPTVTCPTYPSWLLGSLEDIVNRLWVSLPQNVQNKRVTVDRRRRTDRAYVVARPRTLLIEREGGRNP